MSLILPLRLRFVNGPIVPFLTRDWPLNADGSFAQPWEAAGKTGRESVQISPSDEKLIDTPA
jgi:hypothetical protein